MLLATSGRAEPAAAEGLVVTPIQIVGRVAVKREDLDAAVVKGVAVANRPTIGPAETAAAARRAGGDAGCFTPECWRSVGLEVGGAHAVGGEVRRLASTFHVVLRLVRVADGTVLGAEENQCEVSDCSLAELVRLSARELVRQTLGRRAEGASAQASPAARDPAGEPVRGAVATGALSPALATPPEPSSPPADRDRAAAGGASRVGPVLLIGAGTGGIAAGAALVALDGRPTRADRATLHTTRTAGLIALGAGAAVAVAGIVWLVRRAPESSGGTSVAVVVVPGGARLLATF